jgi:tripartite-type tricarboxylate transporter receptor subunit TctC
MATGEDEMTVKLTMWAVALMAGLAMASLAEAEAQTQTWPTKPVKILIPFTAGGTADTLGRLAAQKLSEALGQQFVPENKPGASGLIAAAETVNAIRCSSPASAVSSSPLPSRPIRRPT